MEGKSKTQPENKLKTSITKSFRRKYQQNRLLKISLFVAVNIFLVAFFAAVIIINNQQNSTSHLRSIFKDNQLTKLKTTTPTPIPQEKIDVFLPYSEIDGLEAKENVSNVNDPLLKVSFNYPSSYFMNSLLADGNNLSANIFYLINRDVEKEKGISYVLKCEKDNRVDPVGLCTESMGGDMYVNISIPDEERIDYFLNYESEYDICEIETFSPDKMVKSCTTQMSVDSNDIGMQYTLYLKDEDNERFISLYTRVPGEISDLIKTIIISAKISP